MNTPQQTELPKLRIPSSSDSTSSSSSGPVGWDADGEPYGMLCGVPASVYLKRNKKKTRPVRVDESLLNFLIGMKTVEECVADRDGVISTMGDIQRQFKKRNELYKEAKSMKSSDRLLNIIAKEIANLRNDLDNLNLHYDTYTEAIRLHEERKRVEEAFAAK